MNLASSDIFSPLPCCDRLQQVSAIARNPSASRAFDGRWLQRASGRCRKCVPVVYPRRPSRRKRSLRSGPCPVLDHEADQGRARRELYRRYKMVDHLSDPVGARVVSSGRMPRSSRTVRSKLAVPDGPSVCSLRRRTTMVVMSSSSSPWGISNVRPPSWAERPNLRRGR
jgi:hypothetical protein